MRRSLVAVTLLAADLPDWKTNKIDFYYWYYGTLALHQYDGPNGPMWKKWSEPVKDALVDHQRGFRDFCRNGSWDSEVDRWGSEGGRLYTTAINLLTLEIAFRRGPAGPVFRSPEPPAYQWVFLLTSGGKISALSYEDAGEAYSVKVPTGSVRILKADVEKIVKLALKP